MNPWYYGPYFSAWHHRTLTQYGVRVISPPTVEPISLDEARQHLRVDDFGSPPEHPDDALISAQVSAAREWCEGDLGLSLAPQVLELGRSGFTDGWAWPASIYPEPGRYISLPFGPVAGVVSVSYLDGDNALQTLSPASYTVDTYSRPARLYGAYATSWPTTYMVPNAVKIRYLAGYSLDGDSPMDTEPLPRSLRAMILLTLGHLYEQREQTTELKLMDLPLGVTALGDRYRVRLGMA